MKTSEGRVVIAALMPHAPVLVPGLSGVRDRDAARSVEAMTRAAQRIVEAEPEVLVLISPHSPRRGGGYALWAQDRVCGSLASFGAPALRVDLPCDKAFAGSLADEACARGLEVWWWGDGPLDHGAVVPLWHLAHAGWGGPTVVVGLNNFGTMGPAQLGEAMGAAARREGVRLALVASGDMSHRLQPGAPSGFHPRAIEFDRMLIQTLRGGDLRELLRLDSELQDLAAEDAVDSAVVAAAAVGWSGEGAEVLGYEGPFGVGYGVAILHERRAGAVRSVQGRVQAAAGGGPGRHPDLPGIARRSLEHAFRGDDGMPVRDKAGIASERHAVFVTLRESDGALRGCIGDLSPKFENTAQEVWHLARDAAFRDPRFHPVRAEELEGLRFEVSVVFPLEEVTSIAALDSDRYGVVVEAADGRRGTLLPGVEGVDSVESQLAIARRKGGIGRSEPVRLWRFAVKKYADDEH